MLKTILFVAIGGALGSVLRYLTAVFTDRFWAGHFPLATFLINILGCLLIGLLAGLLEKNNLFDSPLKWLLITGFCGGFTTFSAFAHENYSLFQNQHSLLAFGYIILSITIGLLAIWLGLFLTR